MKVVKVNNYISLHDYWEEELITPEKFAKELNSGADDDVLIKINSGGGLVFAAFDIVNQMLEYENLGRGTITTQITGMAASAAAIVFLASRNRQVFDKSYFMQHRVWSTTYGNRDEIAATADLLRQIDDIIAKDLAYVTKTKVSKVADKISKEWHIVGGQKIIDAGIATELVEGPLQDEELPKIYNQLGEDLPNSLKESIAASAMIANGNKIKSIYPDQKKEKEKLKFPFGIFNKKNENDKEDQVTAEEHEQAIKAERTRICKIVQFAGLTADAQNAIDNGICSGDFAEQILLKRAEQDEQPIADKKAIKLPKNDEGVHQAIANDIDLLKQAEEQKKSIREQIKNEERKVL